MHERYRRTDDRQTDGRATFAKNWRPGQDDDGTRDRRAIKRDVPAKTGRAAFIVVVYCADNISYCQRSILQLYTFLSRALMLLVGRQKWHSACIVFLLAALWPVHTTRVYGPCSRAVSTAREHGCHFGHP